MRQVARPRKASWMSSRRSHRMRRRRNPYSQARIRSRQVPPTAVAARTARSASGWCLGRDVVAVSAGQRHSERDALGVGDDVVLAARTCMVDRVGSAFGPRRAARTWEESITARDQSSFFADRSFFSSSTCSWSPPRPRSTRARRRQQVMPEPEAQLLRQVLPLDPGVQHEQDPAQRLPVRHPRPTLDQLRAMLGAATARPAPTVHPTRSTAATVFPHDRTNERTSQPSHDQPLLLGPLSAARPVKGHDVVIAACWPNPAPRLRAPGRVRVTRRCESVREGRARQGKARPAAGGGCATSGKGGPEWHGPPEEAAGPRRHRPA